MSFNEFFRRIARPWKNRNIKQNIAVIGLSIIFLLVSSFVILGIVLETGVAGLIFLAVLASVLSFVLWAMHQLS